MQSPVAWLTRFLGRPGRPDGANVPPGGAPVEAEPALRRAYHFVRPAAGGPSAIKLTRRERALVIRRYRPHGRWAHDPADWRGALRGRRGGGDVGPAEAGRAGLIGKDEADEVLALTSAPDDGHHD